jgi:DNA repair protein RadA/Sms
MARQKTKYVCQECGYQQVKWLGKCPECSQWNTFEEQLATPTRSKSTSQAKAVSLTDVPLNTGGEIRTRTGIPELDATLGGGMVSGSLTLIGGDPGVGKSTLLLMVAGRLADRDLPVLYASGEESVEQIRMRAKRLGVHSDTLFLLSTGHLEDVLTAAAKLKPLLVIIDSVQTMSAEDLPGLPGSVSQVRGVAHKAMVFAKQHNTATMLVGHITKSGDIAGPKVLEHFVDTVLYFEGDGRSSLRALRAVKNRFGAAGELGLFEMTSTGLTEVPDASSRLLAERNIGVPGTAIVATLEGSRPMLAEIQALVGPPGPATPARTCVGVDRSRVLMILAVLQKTGVPLHDRSVFVNVAGGLSISEPAADLAIAVAICSSFNEQAVPSDYVVLGEIGLVGEVRSVPGPILRLKECARHGFRNAILHESLADLDIAGLRIQGVAKVAEVLNRLC